MIKLILEYDSVHGDIVVDSNIEQYVKDTILYINEKKTVYRKVGSTLLFNMFRAAVAENEIDYKEVIIHFEKKEYILNEDGSMDYWPEGLADTDLYILDKLVGWTK